MNFDSNRTLFNSPHISIPANNTLGRDFTSPTRVSTPSTPYTPCTPSRKTCHCKQSKCLKLYCDCFAAGIFCEKDKCTCKNCCNNPMFEKQRNQAIETVLSRDPNAFRLKAQEINETVEIGRIRGCNCKKSNCLKKYCECYQAGLSCTDNCKCVDCKNYDSKFRRNYLSQISNPPLSFVNKQPQTPLLSYATVIQQQQQQQQIDEPSLTIPLPPSTPQSTDILLHADINTKSPISAIITPSLLEDLTKKLIKAYLTSEIDKNNSMIEENNTDNNEDVFKRKRENNEELYCFEVLRSDRYSRNERYVLHAYAEALDSINEKLKDYSRDVYGGNNRSLNNLKYNPNIHSEFGEEVNVINTNITQFYTHNNVDT